MNFNQHFETGWRKTVEFLGPIVLLTLVQVVVTFATIGFLGPVTMAGYMKSLMKALRQGRVPEVGDLFSEMSLFIQLTACALVIGLATFIGFIFLVLPGIAIILAVLFGFLYTIPLMIDSGLPILEAVKKSWNLSIEKPITDQVIVSVIFVAITCIGSSIPLVFLFSQPMATFFILSVYEQRLIESRKIIEEQSAP